MILLRHLLRHAGPTKAQNKELLGNAHEERPGLPQITYALPILRPHLLFPTCRIYTFVDTAVPLDTLGKQLAGLDVVLHPFHDLRPF